MEETGKSERLPSGDHLQSDREQTPGAVPRPAHAPAFEPAVDGELDVLLGRCRAVHPPPGSHAPVGVQVLAVVGQVDGELQCPLRVSAPSTGEQLGAELLNFGAFIAFMGVNAAAFVRYWLRSDRKRWDNLVPPILGFLICFYIWLSLRWPAKVAGAIWLTFGVIYGAVKTKGFRKNLVSFELPPE